MTKKEKEIYPRSRKEMLRIIKTAEKEGHLLETALEEFTIHPFSMLALWDCREYIWGIGQENYLKKPLIISLLALLSTMAGRLDEAKDFSYNDFGRVSTELVMPYTDDFSFLRIVFFLIDVGAVPILSLTLSACRPSILNGFRDFTRLGPYLERYRDTVTDTVQKLYGSGGNGVYEILLAEWYYQNNNCFQALVLVTGTIPLMEQEKDMRCLFVALALQMKILLVNGQTRTAKPLVEKIRDRIHKTGWEELTSSLNALECLAACYDGRNDEVEEWLDKVAPDEIANKMGKKTGTVKFHSNNIFRKLQVQNRQQAVNRGREINLL